MRVAKWGNSLAVRLPDVVVKTLKLKSGDEIEIVVTGERKFEVERDKSRELALARLRAVLDEAAVRPQVRHATKPTRASQRRRVDSKVKHGLVKAQRSRVID